MRNRYLLLYCLTVLILTVTPGIHAVEVAMSIDRTLIDKTGGVINLTVTVVHGVDEKILYEESDIHLRKDFRHENMLSLRYPKEKLDVDSLNKPIHTVIKKQVGSKTLIEEVFQYSLQPFEVDSMRLRPIKFIILKGGKRFALFAPYTYIHVIPPEGNMFRGLSLKDIATPDMDEEPMSDSSLTVIIVGSIVLVLVGVGAWRVYRWRIIDQDQLKAPLMLADNALNGILDQIIAKPPSQLELGDMVYSPLSAAIKHYIERVWHVAMLERNTTEIISELSHRNIHPDVVSQVGRLLSRCDTMKYSLSPGDSEAMKGDIQAGRDIIHSIEAIRVTHNDIPQS
ncbi:MAG: hypothetical protein OEZ36_07980 [Spirochaetota bacterium]|nr:hypothetical protein [Spirochaetota bacterium]